jgi:Mor family transcriptional regulator
MAYEEVGMKRLTEHEVAEMRQLNREGTWTLPQLAARYGVSTTAIYQAVRGKTWARVATEPCTRMDHRMKLTECDVVEMRRLYHDVGCTVQQLAERYQVSTSAVHNAVRGVTWSHVKGLAG